MVGPDVVGSSVEQTTTNTSGKISLHSHSPPERGDGFHSSGHVFAQRRQSSSYRDLTVHAQRWRLGDEGARKRQR